jgi:hypothetical protein
MTRLHEHDVRIGVEHGFLIDVCADRTLLLLQQSAALVGFSCAPVALAWLLALAIASA